MNKSIPKISAYMTPNPHSIGLRQTLAKAYEQMRAHGVRHLTVLAGEKLVGVLADPDIRTVELLKGNDIAGITVEQAMTPVPYSVSKETPLDEVAKEMAAQKYDAAVVMEGAVVIGVFTTNDALRALADVLHGSHARKDT